jgi:uncharacterized protein (DUF1697 family)
MIKYVALLRGINVGGNKLIKMADLSRIFASLGLKNVKTYIQSGNVLFESAKSDPVALTEHIEKGLRAAVGFEVPVVLRTVAEIEAIAKLNPFSKVKADADAKLYVTFLVEALKTKPKVPLLSPKKDCEIIHLNPREVFIVAFRMGNGRYGESMALIEKEFGKAVTTRNWNTVIKILALAGAGKA